MPLHADDDPAPHLEDLRTAVDRIDIHIAVPVVNYRKLRSTVALESSAYFRKRILRARDPVRSLRRGKERIYANAQMSSRLIRKYCDLGTEAEHLLEPRAHIAEAIQHRRLDRTF